MNVIVYGDFNYTYSYLASQQADLLSRSGIVVDWRAVEHNRSLPVTGSRSDRDRAAWDWELAEVASLALPAEHVPAGPPTLISSTRRRWPLSLRRSATALRMSCAAACSTSSGCRDGMSAAPTRCAA